MKPKQKIILPDIFINYLVGIPESGMGFHKVNVILKDGQTLKNQIVLNSSILSIDLDNVINAEDIDKIEIVL